MPESALKLAAGLYQPAMGVVSLTGPDAADFLNRLSTLDFKKWDASRTRLGAFLTGRSGVVALGYFQSAPDGFHYIVPQHVLATALEHIEKFHFAERMQIQDVSKQWDVAALVGGAGQWADAWLPEVQWSKVPAGSRAPSPVQDERLLEFAWIEKGAPRVGVDIDSTVMILEAGLERAVDRGKGCYPGQEVVERIFTYGQVNRKLFPVRITGDWKGQSLPMKFSHGDRVGATLVGALSNPQGGADAGLAFVTRALWETAEPFVQDGIKIDVRHS